jgi:hypothetical protein
LCHELGLGYDDSVLVATNHEELRQAIRWASDVLTSLLGTSFQPWSAAPTRTEADVLELLSRAAAVHPTTPVDDVSAQLRLGVNKVKGRGKPRGAIGAEAARVAHVQQLTLGQVLAPLAVGSPTDRQMLAELESIDGGPDEGEVYWKAASLWSVAAGEYLSRDLTTYSVAGFCNSLGDRWKELSGAPLEEFLKARIRPRTRSAVS